MQSVCTKVCVDRHFGLMPQRKVRMHACVFVLAVAFFVATGSAWKADDIVRFIGEDMTVSKYDALCTEKIRSLMLGPQGENVFDALLIRSQTRTKIIIESCGLNQKLSRLPVR